MSSKMPPVPEGNRSPKDSGGATEPEADQSEHNRHIANDSEKTGQEANTAINTTHQGNRRN